MGNNVVDISLVDLEDDGYESLKDNYEDIQEVFDRLKRDIEFLIQKGSSEIKNRELQILEQMLKREIIQEELERSQNKYEILFNSTRDATFIIKPDCHQERYKISEVNKYSQLLLGFEKDELESKCFEEIVTHDEIDRLKMNLRKLSHEQNSLFETSILSKDCREIIVEINATLFNLKGYKYILANARDMSFRKELENKQRIQEQLLIQKSKLAEMGEMIGAIAHQWRQPLNALGILIQDIEDAHKFNLLDDVYLRDVVVNGMNLINHMSKTIDDFRNFLKPNKNMVRFNIIEAMINLTSLINSQLDNLRVYIEMSYNEELILKDNRVINLQYYDVDAFGYPNEFKQVVLNIINNAKDAIIENRTKYEFYNGKIDIKISKDSESIKIIIKDNGTGIPDKILSRIYEPYYSTKEEGQGTGLGLYLAKVIIEKSMNGRLYAYNNSDIGSSFCIELRTLKEQN